MNEKPVVKADAVAALSGAMGHDVLGEYPDVLSGLIDSIQSGMLEAFEAPDGELRFRMTEIGKRYVEELSNEYTGDT